MLILTDRFEQALILANQLHASQVRKGVGTPYISHLLAVSSLVLENGGSENEVIAALLHDAVEDQGGKSTLELIRSEFGNEVATIVSGCSDADTIPKPPWRERKEAYLKHLANASPSVRLVSVADKLHNARATLRDYQVLGEELWGRFTGGKDGTLWYFRSLVVVFSSFGFSPLLNEFIRVVAEIECIAGSGCPPVTCE
jgi:GTP pyrophosphokinase